MAGGNRKEMNTKLLIEQSLYGSNEYGLGREIQTKNTG